MITSSVAMNRGRAYVMNHHEQHLSVFALKDSWFSLSLEHGVIAAHPGSDEGDLLFSLWL